MNFLIVSRISIPAKDRTLPCWEYLRSLGHTVTVEHPGSAEIKVKPDVIISMGISIMDETFEALKRFPGVPLYCYNWDVYEWVWDPNSPAGTKQAYHAIRNQGQQREYNYVKYGNLLNQAREVWVPSRCTGHRTQQWYGIKQWSTILSACPYWGHPNPVDLGYVLCCLREIPDKHWGMLERVCKKHGLPLQMPKHELPYDRYQFIVAHCRFIVAPLYELSTGGLSLMEAYYLGKPVLISNSQWNGGFDYFGDRAEYFQDGDEDSLGHMLLEMYNKPKCYRVREDHKQYIEIGFSDRRMVDDMLLRIERTKQ